MVAKNIVSPPPLTVPILEEGGNVSRDWAIWFRDIYMRTSFKGGNAIDQEATELLFGRVKQMALVANAINSTVSIASAPALYDQTYTETVRAGINQLNTDLNNVVIQLNAILSNSKTSGQMNDV